MLAEQMMAAISGAPLRNLDDLSRDIWRALSAGLLIDDEAQRLAEMIHERRLKVRNGSNPVAAAQNGEVRTVRSWSYFPPKKPVQRSSDRNRSLCRRRQLAASGPLPPALAAHFTVGELAVLRIVGDEVRHCGVCGLSIPEIAARAGVGQTKVRMALRGAERLGLITIEERRQHCRPNLPNLVRIISREWLGWIARTRVTQRTANPLMGADCKSAGYRVEAARKSSSLTGGSSKGGGFTSVKATDIRDSKREDRASAFSRETWRMR